MKKSLFEDIESNKKGKLAFQRFKLLPRLKFENQLKLKLFIKDSAGIEILDDWLQPLPDGNFPNEKIVLCILKLVDRIDPKKINSKMIETL